MTNGAATPFPSADDVATIVALSDPVVRNLQITQAYHELSTALLGLTGPACDWCTFATWASKQAGQTIRGEDLTRKIQSDLSGLRLVDSRGVADVVDRARELLRTLERPIEDLVIAGAVHDVFSPERIIERCSEAVARGNRKVFEEIGRAFALFVPLVRDAAGRHDKLQAAAEAVGAALRPGDPPDGQQLLRDAFRDYALALSTTDPERRAELMLLANLRIGYHEQTRLQPDIADAMNVAVPEPGTLTEAVLARLPEQSLLARLRQRLAGREATSAAHARLGAALDRLTEDVRRRVRILITAEFMTLALPDGILQLGANLPATFPPTLSHPSNPELIALLERVAWNPPPPPPPHDWADLPQRMHYIATLFRARQDDGVLFGGPFPAEQVEAIKQGRIPPGAL